MEDLVDALLSGRLSREAFLRQAKADRLLALSASARLDLSRRARTGIPEIVLAEGKRDEDLREIVGGLVAAGERVVVSRLAPQRLGMLAADHPDAVRVSDAVAGLLVLSEPAAPPASTGGRVALLTGGTSDRPRADEAALVAREMGSATQVWGDVGVAGLHRLLAALAEAAAFDPHVYVVAAGREGTLPSVVAGLVDRPVIGLPVSVGYGRGAMGEAALDSMLQSCSPLVVVNIDAGTIAGAMAARIAGLAARGGNGDPAAGRVTTPAPGPRP